MGEGVTAYREVTAPSEIARELREAGFLGESITHHLQGSRLDKRVLEAAGFEAFASFRTNRLKYRYMACQEDGRAQLVFLLLGLMRMRGPNRVLDAKNHVIRADIGYWVITQMCHAVSPT